MSDVLSILGNSECEVVSCVDIKDAYHSIPLTEQAENFAAYYHILVARYIDMRFYLWALHVLHKSGWIT